MGIVPDIVTKLVPQADMVNQVADGAEGAYNQVKSYVSSDGSSDEKPGFFSRPFGWIKDKFIATKNAAKSVMHEVVKAVPMGLISTAGIFALSGLSGAHGHWDPFGVAGATLGETVSKGLTALGVGAIFTGGIAGYKLATAPVETPTTPVLPGKIATAQNFSAAQQPEQFMPPAGLPDMGKSNDRVMM